MAGEVFIDALPYYDQGYDEPGVKEAAYALIEEETRRYRPTKNYLELLTPIDELPFETEILRREFERMSSRLPMESLSMKRYELPPPPIGRQNDLSAWTECVENSMAQLEHQSERIANLELLSKYGGFSWRLHNDLLTKMLDGAQKELQVIRKEIQEINWNRKKAQTEAGTTLKTLQESWVKLVTKNYEIERACQDLELDLEKMKQKQEDIREQKKKQQRRKAERDKEAARKPERDDGKKREKERRAERDREEGRRLQRVERERGEAGKMAEERGKTDRVQEDDTRREGAEKDGEGRPRTSVEERNQTEDGKRDKGKEDEEERKEGPVEATEGARGARKSDLKGSDSKENEDEVIEVDDDGSSSSSSSSGGSDEEESPPRRKRERSPARKDKEDSPPRKKDKDEKEKDEEVTELKRVEFRAEDYPEELL